MYKQYKCYSCDAEFKIKHSLDSDAYDVYYCPFCGGEIEDEEDEELDDYE
jgi:DNA-directed RNA polymerase subunit RPC12/RpoP